MARFNMSEADNYGASKNNYFSLKDDRDTAKVRFLYNDINDVEGVAVHEVEIGNNRIDVECLRAYNEPVSKCPLCEAGYKVNAKLFVPVYDLNSNESKIWTRGKTFFSKLSSLCSRYNPLVATTFEIERVGKKGDTNTTYETYPIDTDKSVIEDFPEINAEGIAFEVKTANEMYHFLDNGAFPEKNNSRAGSRQSQTEDNSHRRGNRETPVNQNVNTPVRRRPQYNDEDNF